jgi:hypothetical protein
MSTPIKFGDLPDSREKQFLRTAGVQIKYKLKAYEFKERAEKEGMVTNAMLKLTFENDHSSFSGMLFEPPYSEDNVKFTGDLYEHGVKVRKRTPAEEIEAQFYEKFYFFEQLMKALGADKITIESFKKVSGDTKDLFKMMVEKFFTLFPLTAPAVTNKFINFKTAWNNNTSKKTSYLGLCKPSASNVIFAAYVADDVPVLSLNSTELKNQQAMFTDADRAPKTDGAEGEGSWRPPDDAPQPMTDADGNARPLF